MFKRKQKTIWERMDRYVARDSIENLQAIFEWRMAQCTTGHIRVVQQANVRGRLHRYVTRC